MSIPARRPRRRRLAAGVHGRTVAGRVSGPVAGRVRGPAVAGRVGGPAVVGALAALALAVAGCSTGGNSAKDTASSTAVINAIGAENEYANVLAQIGGRYVHVSSILNDPNTDPHTFEASPQVAQEVSAADLIVQNGAG